MEILEIKDRDDEYCDLDCEFTDEEIKILLNYAVNRILKEYIEKEENKNE